jgi:predicted nucleic acid-binding protein
MTRAVEANRIVIDSSILFSALLQRRSRRREIILTDGERTFFCPRFVMVEMFKHKERIAAASALGEEELLECLNALLARIHFLEEGIIPMGTWMEGRRLCADVDAKDTPFVTLALHVDGHLWTTDAELEAGLRTRGFDHFFSA